MWPAPQSSWEEKSVLSGTSFEPIRQRIFADLLIVSQFSAFDAGEPSRRSRTWEPITTVSVFLQMRTCNHTNYDLLRLIIHAAMVKLFRLSSRPQV